MGSEKMDGARKSCATERTTEDYEKLHEASEETKHTVVISKSIEVREQTIVE